VGLIENSIGCMLSSSSRLGKVLEISVYHLAMFLISLSFQFSGISVLAVKAIEDAIRQKAGVSSVIAYIAYVYPLISFLSSFMQSS
jgi:hypothetical protein